LPKTIRRSDGKSAGAIVGFANFVLRLNADERPRAVIVGWDSLGAPTKRQEMFPAYQSGREFDDDLIEQLYQSSLRQTHGGGIPESAEF
jgi:DNA polymerase-1